MFSTQNLSVFSADSSTPNPAHPKARPFLLPGGPHGILFVHGYGGSIGDFRGLAERFQAAGYTAAGVCVAGHGQTPAVLAQTHVADWRESVFQAARELGQSVQDFVIVGGSFGGALALDYALHAPAGIRAVVTINTGLSYQGAGQLQKIVLRLLSLVKKTHPKKFATVAAREQTAAVGSLLEWPINGILENYEFIERFVRPGLARLSPPLLVLVDPHDPVIRASSAQELFQQAGAHQKEYQELSGGGHNPLRSQGGQTEVFERITSWLTRLETQT